MDQMTDAETMNAQRRRRPLTMLGKVTLAALFALTLLFVFQQVMIGAFFPPIGIVQATVALVLAGIVAVGWRWAPALAAGVHVLSIVANFPFIVQDLGNPGAIFEFIFTIIALLLVLVVIVAGITATVQNYSQRG